MTHKMQRTLDSREVTALDELALDELRDIRQQARQLVREGLQLKGRLDTDDVNTEENDD